MSEAMVKLTLSKLFCVFQNSIFREKMDLLGIFFISIPENIVLFSRQSKMLASKQHYSGKNTEISPM